jgi:uncharacterized protein (TIGR00255 family)
MTGFGRGETEAAGLRIGVEVRTVNHRHLDVEVRGSVVPAELCGPLQRAVALRLHRGKVDVLVVLTFTAPGAQGLRVNRVLAAEYVGALRQLAADLALPGEITTAHLAQLPWGRTFELAEPVLTTEQREAVLLGLDRALDAVVEARRREGAELARDLRTRSAALRAMVERVQAEAAGAAAQQLARLTQRLRELSAEVPVDPQRLAQEAAILADRADIQEELTRAAAHLAHVDDLLDAPGPHGKKLDFTLQELFREVNTMGSKSRDLDVAARIIDMKSEVERMREQVANVE